MYVIRDLKVKYEDLVSLTGKKSSKIAAASYEPLVSVFDGTPNADLQNLGKVDFSAASPTEASESLSRVYIPKTGDYYLYICGDGKGAFSTFDTWWYLNLHSLTFTPTFVQDLANTAFSATQDSDYSSETAPTIATVKTLALYGETSDVIKEKIEVTYGKSTNISAVDKTHKDEAGDTYNFLYWAKGLNDGVGNKHIISTSNEQFSYKPHEGANYLIAVYEKAGAEKKQRSTTEMVSFSTLR